MYLRRLYDLPVL
ncbi:hypothetical protein YPPY32_0278, partial [Yersinia pestis PY-32]